MRLDDYDTSERFEATVRSSTRMTAVEAEAEVREILLGLDQPDFEARPGQSIGVLVPGPHDFGHEHHFRLYTVADTESDKKAGETEITIAVRRCTYIDEYSGERFDGIASNFLCDSKPGESFEIAGPYGYAFEVPEEKDANLILIGAGTGIAPFRAFVKHIYQDIGDWRGKVRLFYGAHTGLEHIYMNEHRDDFAQYYDEATFEAFKAVSPRPHWADPIAWEQCFETRSEEILEMLADPKTYVYVAGLETVRDELDQLFFRMAGRETWQCRKAALIEAGRWTELLY